MIDWIERANAVFQKTPQGHTDKTDEKGVLSVSSVGGRALSENARGGFVGFVGTDPAPFVKNDVFVLPCWRLSFRGSNPIEVTFSPPVDRIEALRWYPTATDAEPVDRCQTCAHYRRPGLSDGYCVTRSDPPKSGYALLRQLPDDRGACCDHHTLSEAWK